MDEMIMLKDPNGVGVFYDRKSLGVAVLNHEILSFSQDLLKKCIQKPPIIISLSDTERHYFSSINKKMIFAVVVQKEDYWYVNSLNIETELSVMQANFAKGKIIYQNNNPV